MNTPPVKPSVGFLLSHPAHFVALGAGSGLSPVAPGTVGTLWAWLCFALLWPHLNLSAWGWVLGLGLVGGWWVCTFTARALNTPDPGAVVWDEIIAFWLILIVLSPASLWTQCVAFLLFRFFDAAKPGPVGWADQRYKPRPTADGQPGDIGWREGWGIIFDDLVAAGCTLLVMAAWKVLES